VIIQALGLQPTGQTSIVTPSTRAIPHNANQYDVSIRFQMPGVHFGLLALPVTEAILKHQGFQALIGTDVLNHGLFIYDGTAKIFILSF
jgi:hypothetical protein